MWLVVETKMGADMLLVTMARREDEDGKRHAVGKSAASGR
jgi:hypothetical protein